MKSNDTTCGDWNFLTCFWITTWTLWFISQLKVAETREFDRLTALKCIPNFIEKCFNHILGLTFIQPNVLEKQLGKLGLG